MTALTARVAGTIHSPRRTMAWLASFDSPPWVDALAVSTLAGFLAHSAFLSTAVGRLALVDQWERLAIAFGIPVDAALYARLHEASSHGIAYSAVAALVLGPLVTALVSGLLLVVVRSGGQRRVSLHSVLSVTSHASLILGLRQVVVTPINYATETLASPVTASRLLTGFDESAPLARLLGVIDLFVVWWVVVLAIGAALLAQRRARAFALTLAGLYVALAVVLAAAMAIAGGAA